jgi:cyclophilin family peptidyl-prolyl cis-trans isomerase
MTELTPTENTAGANPQVVLETGLGHIVIEVYEDRAPKNAAYFLELQAAAVSLEHGFAWAGQKLEAGMIKVMDDARHVAGKLIEGAGWAADEAGKAIEYLGREIDNLGKAVAG